MHVSAQLVAAVHPNALDAKHMLHVYTRPYEPDYAAAALGFFVPYFDLDVILLPTPPCFLSANALA